MADAWPCRVCGECGGHSTLDHTQVDRIRTQLHQVMGHWWDTASDTAKARVVQEGGALEDLRDTWRWLLDAAWTARCEAMWRVSVPPPVPEARDGGGDGR